MEKPTNPKLVLAAAVLLMVLAANSTVFAQSLNWHNNSQEIVAPESIPIKTNDTPAADDVAMSRLRFEATSGTLSVGQITIDYLGTDASKVTEIGVYLSKTAFDGTETSLVPAATTYTFTSDPITLNLDTAETFDTAWNYLYVTLDFDSTAASTMGSVAGVNVTSIEWGAPGYTPGTGTTAVPDDQFSTTVPLQDYRVNLTPTGIAPATSQDQGKTKVPVLKLEFSRPYSDVTPHIDSISLHRIGTASDGDIADGGVVLYYDNGATPGTFEGDETAVPLGSGTLGGGYATLGPGLNLAVDDSEIFFVAVNVAPDASYNPATNTVGLEIADITDVTFTDELDEDDTLYAPPFEYLQSGYLLTVPAQSDNTFDIQELVLPDTTAPDINVTIPTNGGTLDALDSPVNIYWSEDVHGAGEDPVADAANFSLQKLGAGGGAVPFSLSYASSGSTHITTVIPDTDDPLWAYESFYELTITAANIFDDAGTPNYLDDNPLYTTADPTIMFGTGLEFPEFNEPAVLKNRIGSGANSEAVILIPTPPSGSFAGLSVQVFTTTGRLVKTFRGAEIETTSGGRKIIWDGTNDRGADLGPGMYFVQVRVAGTKRVLKVMIVR